MSSLSKVMRPHKLTETTTTPTPIPIPSQRKRTYSETTKAPTTPTSNVETRTQSAKRSRKEPETLPSDNEYDKFEGDDNIETSGSTDGDGDYEEIEDDIESVTEERATKERKREINLDDERTPTYSIETITNLVESFKNTDIDLSDDECIGEVLSIPPAQRRYWHLTPKTDQLWPPIYYDNHLSPFLPLQGDDLRTLIHSVDKGTSVLVSVFDTPRNHYKKESLIIEAFSSVAKDIQSYSITSANGKNSPTWFILTVDSAANAKKLLNQKVVISYAKKAAVFFRKLTLRPHGIRVIHILRVHRDTIESIAHFAAKSFGGTLHAYTLALNTDLRATRVEVIAIIRVRKEARVAMNITKENNQLLFEGVNYEMKGGIHCSACQSDYHYPSACPWKVVTNNLPFRHEFKEKGKEKAVVSSDTLINTETKSRKRVVRK
ncbi:hypothetical protein AMATHDRAFT_51826 [Amanita thiersii Skay4041]|uniref:Uncharacterized protein n=1 Tax=Amanita thiersii Skay4041 TaxID=703135 RepID=A0A2A9N5Z7_9AGAR|nr:hypothetical protein AMATHDRAFT_51826 [Amanita thiersii Skay4041]